MVFAASEHCKEGGRGVVGGGGDQGESIGTRGEERGAGWEGDGGIHGTREDEGGAGREGNGGKYATREEGGAGGRGTGGNAEQGKRGGEMGEERGKTRNCGLRKARYSHQPRSEVKAWEKGRRGGWIGWKGNGGRHGIAD